MTLGELLLRLHGPRCPILSGTAAETLELVRVGRHPDPAVGEILLTIVQWCAPEGVQAVVDRAAVVNALGPLRRRYMAGEGTPEGFRMLNCFVEAVDKAFDQESLDRARALH